MKALARLVAIAAVFIGSAQAASVSWRVPVYADISTAPGVVQRKALLPLQTTLELQYGGVGITPGFVIAGAARMDPDALPWPGPLTPYVTKVSELDGHIAWRWQPDQDVAVEGRIRQVAIFQGTLVAAIGYREVNGVRTSLLVLLDGQTGKPIWRIDGEPGTSGYGVVFDGGGDIVAMSYGSNMQSVARYAHTSGDLMWSRSIADANDDWDDFKLSFSELYNYLSIAGHYALPAPLAESGVQIGRFDLGGELRFSARYPATSTVAVGAVQETSYGAALMDAGGFRRQLDHFDWAQPTSAVFPPGVQILDDIPNTGGLYVIGDADNGAAGHAAQVDQLATATGESQWHEEFTADAPVSSAKALRRGPASPAPCLMFAWTSEFPGMPRRMHATALIPNSPDVLWQVDFGSADPDNENNPVDIRLGRDNGVFVSALTNEASDISTATLYKLIGSFTDDIFDNGYD